MALAVRAGTFAANTATGNQVVSLATGGNWPASTTPKLVMFFASGQTADGAAATGAGMVGAATASSAQWVLSQASDPNPAAAINAGQSARTNACIVILTNGTPTVQSVATFVSFGADQFTINWTTQTSPPAGRDIFYICYGGADLTNVVAGNATIPTATGNQAISPTGFTGITPDALITAVACQTASPTESVHSHFGLGFATRLPSTAQGVAAMLEVDASTAIDTLRLFRTDACVGGGETTATTLTRGALNSWDANGFTINWADASATASHMWFYVAIKGGTWQTGVETEQTTNTTKVTSLSGFPGLTPRGLLLAGSNGTADTATTGDTANGDCLIAMGVSDGTNEASIANIQINGSASTSNSFAVRYQSSTAALGLVKTPVAASATVAGTADATFQSGQFTLTWASTDGTARRFLYLAAGDNAVARRAILSWAELEVPEAPVVTTFTLSGSGTLPVPSGSGTGLTVTAPVYTLSGGGTVPVPAGGGAGLHITNPTYTLSGAGAVPAPAGSGTGLVVSPPTYTLSGAASVPAPTGGGAGLTYRSLSTLSGGGTVPVPTGSGAGLTNTAPVYTLSGSGTLPAPVGSGTGLAVTNPSYTLSGSATVPAPGGSGVGLQFAAGFFILSGNGSVPAPSGSGAGLTNTAPVYTLTGNGTIPAPGGSGIGLTYRSLGILSGTGTVGAPTGGGAGLAVTNPVYTISGSGTVPAPAGGGTGLVSSAPIFTLSGAATVAAPTGTGAGLTIAVPVYTLTGNGTIGAPAGSGDGLTFVPLIGDGQASGAIAVAALVPAYTATGELMAAHTVTATLVPTYTVTAELVPVHTATAGLVPARVATPELVPTRTATPELVPARTATPELVGG